MARNKETTENTSTETSGKPKRRFGVSTANIPTSVPTIKDGIYVGNIKNLKADAADKMMAGWFEVEDLQLFDVIEIITGKKDARVHTGEYKIVGAITYMVELQNVPGTQELPMDTMTIFGGRLDIHFAKDNEGNWGLDNSVNDYGIVNRTMVAFYKAVGLTDDEVNEIAEATPFDEDQEFTIPERLANVPGVEDMLAACLYYKTFFSLICEHVNGKEVKVNVLRRNKRNEPNEFENAINTGNFGSSCGLLPVGE